MDQSPCVFHQSSYANVQLWFQLGYHSVALLVNYRVVCSGSISQQWNGGCFCHQVFPCLHRSYPKLMLEQKMMIHINCIQMYKMQITLQIVKTNLFIYII